MSESIEYASQSASILEASPSATDPGSQELRLSGDASANIRALLDVEIDVPQAEDADVVESLLYLTKSAPWPAAADVTIQRADRIWDSATATWTNKPDPRAGSIVETIPTGGAAGDEFVIDVTTLIAAAFTDEDVNDIGYYGLILSIAATGERNFYSAFAADQAVRPYLHTHYNVPPGIATDLSPSDGLAVGETKPKLFFEPDDEDGEDTIAGIHIQIDDVDTMASPFYDSGELSHTEPSFDLDAPPTGAPVTPTLGAGPHFWRVRYQDNHGAWSDWSDVAEFTYSAKGVLTITAPASITSPVPEVTHSLTVETQDEVEFEVERKEDGVWQEHYFLPFHESAAVSHQVPDDSCLERGYRYRLIKRVRPTTSRDDLPGDRDFYEATIEGDFV